MIESGIIAALMAMLCAIAIAIARHRNLFGVVVLLGAYSFIMATTLAALDAADVAMTEAAVGAGISTVLMLSALHLVQGLESKPTRGFALPLLASALAGALVVYGTLGLPEFGDPRAPMHRHVAPRYLEQGLAETGVPNIVTAVLASYRGYDTLGETTVVFTAGIGVIALLRRRPKPKAPER